MKISRLFNVFVILYVFFAFGCVPSYKVSPDKETAKIKSMHGFFLYMCVDGKSYSLSQVTENGEYLVPVDRRISIEADVQISRGDHLITCKPGLSFIPKAGELYINDVYVDYTSCYIDLVRNDEESVSGVKIERSVDRWGPCIK